MKTFEEHKKITIYDLLIDFDFIDFPDEIYFYQKNYIKPHDWIFYCNKHEKYINVDYNQYEKLNTGLAFEDFIKPFNLTYNRIVYYN